MNSYGIPHRGAFRDKHPPFGCTLYKVHGPGRMAFIIFLMIFVFDTLYISIEKRMNWQLI